MPVEPFSLVVDGGRWEMGDWGVAPEVSVGVSRPLIACDGDPRAAERCGAGCDERRRSTVTLARGATSVGERGRLQCRTW